MKEAEISCEIPGRPTDGSAKLDDFVPCRENGCGALFSGKYFETDTALENIDSASALNLTLPKAIYGLTGEELAILPENFFLLHDKSSVKVDIKCAVGSFDGKWWRFCADKAGRYLLKTVLYDRAGRVLGEAETEIVISDICNGNEQNISLMMIGDSLFAGGQTAGVLLENMRCHGNPNFRLIGSHSGAGAPLSADGAAVEAYGGWRWAHFIERYEESELYNRKSKFLRLDPDGSKTLDFKAYLQKYNQGNAPDVIVILLGCNDIAHASMDNFAELLENSRAYRKRLLDHIHSQVPETLIGLATLPPANCRHQAYLDNYHGVVVHQQYRYNQLLYVKQLLKDYQDDRDFSIIPFYHSIDPAADYPEDNSIHPNMCGYEKFASSIEAWLKAMF